MLLDNCVENCMHVHAEHDCISLTLIESNVARARFTATHYFARVRVYNNTLSTSGLSGGGGAYVRARDGRESSS